MLYNLHLFLFKKYVIIFIIVVVSTKSIAQVGIGIDEPKPEAALDIDSENQGVFIPSVDLQDLNDLNPITTGTAEESLLVYNNNSNTGKGFYYWNGVDRWIAVKAKSKNRGMQFYAYSIPEEASPNIMEIISEEKPDASGLLEAELNFSEAALSSSILTPTNNGVVIKIIGFYEVKNEGVFNIESFTDDGAKLFVDGTLIINEWDNAGASGNSASETVKLGVGKHKFEFWYYDYNGPHFLEFSWGTNPDGLSGFINTMQFSID